MGKLVRMLGTGVGLVAESIQAHREKSREKAEHGSRSSSSIAGPSSSDAGPSSASHHRYADEPPPAYAEVPDDQADQLIKSGKAVPVKDDEVGEAKRHISKAQEAGYGNEDDSDSSDDEFHDALAEDEAAWELDEMASTVAPDNQRSEAAIEAEAAAIAKAPEDVKKRKEEEALRNLIAMAGPAPNPPRRLPMPVIIPQRRPRDKDRGFVRAYAPVLADINVSEEFFLKFLKDWYIASKASPWINVVFIAAAVVGFVPEAAAQITATVVQVAAGTARELQSRARRNTFLDRINDEVFVPRGQYAMIMAFKEDMPGTVNGGPLSRLTNELGSALFTQEHLDINQTAMKYANPDEMTKMRRQLKNIRLMSGTTHTQLELPEAAPLVYPELDRAAQQDLNAENPGKTSKWKNAGKFVQGYLDHRAQARYEYGHQGSALATPSSQQGRFLTRWGDPNGPAQSGSLISLLTGGAINPAQRRMEHRQMRYENKAARREWRDERRVARGRLPKGQRRMPKSLARAQDRDAQTFLGKVFRQNVLYLIIVNLPTKQEMDEGVARLEQVVSQASRS